MQRLVWCNNTVVNDRPIGIYQLLLGRTSTIQQDLTEVETGDVQIAGAGLPILLPFYRWEEAKGQKNLRVGDYCPALV